MEIIIGVVCVLIIVIMILIVYNLSISKKVKTLNNTREMVANLQVLQDFMDIIGSDNSVDHKIQLINNILVEKYQIKYSSIVVFNGAEYILKASNTDEKFWDVLKNLHTDDMFKDSIMSATPKYVTVDGANERLAYQKKDMIRAKSAMFFPLYIDNIYIGYWIIESNEAHAFDNMDTNILNTIKENIVSVLKTVSYQNTIENIYRIDKITGLCSAEYLYGKGKRDIDKYDESYIGMFNITNIEVINQKFNRNIGTKIIQNVANAVKTNIPAEYIFVRYMGPKFAIAFLGMEEQNVVRFLTTLKTKIEKIAIPVEIKRKTGTEKILVKPKVNFVISSYYKGTGIEAVTKRLEQFLDNCDKSENDITSI